MLCKVCQQATAFFTKAKILDKYHIQYFQCQNCGFIQTEEPYWLDEAYTEAINDSDIGLLNRNFSMSRVAQAVIFSFFDNGSKFLDYGGGYGLFVRLMRDAGIDFYHFDRFCENLFAKGFEANLVNQNKYELVTAFEVFEHLVQPLNEIEQMLKFSRNIFFSTSLIPASNPKPTEWWYYGLDHGQHVSLYTLKSLAAIADQFQLNLYTNGNRLHLLTERSLSYPFFFKWVTRYKVALLVSSVLKKRSLITDDYFKLTGRSMN